MICKSQVRAVDSPRNAASAGQGSEVHLLGEVVGVGPVAEAGAHPPHLRLSTADEGRRRHPIAGSGGEGQLRELVHWSPVHSSLVHSSSLAAGNQAAQSGDLLGMRCDTLREALSARLDGEDPGLDDTAIDGHLGTCGACSAWSDELTTLHRMVRVREAEPVPDLSGPILGIPAARPTRRAARRDAISPARWALFVVALTQLVLAAPALLLGEDVGATVHVAPRARFLRRRAGDRPAGGGVATRAARGDCSR